MKYLIAIDQGTTGTTACLINTTNFAFVDKVNLEFKQIYPKPGWVEHNLNDIWSTVEHTITNLLKNNNISENSIIGIGITNQRETTCAFDNNGQPLANAIVWQDRRTSDFCQNLRDKGYTDKIKNKTGLPIDPYFSASKMRWLLKNNDEITKSTKNNNLKLGTIDTYLLFKLSGNKSFKTEVSNSSRTMLMDLKSRSWDQELIDMFELDQSFLPEINDSFSIFGHTKGLSFLPDGIPISGILGDQQSALFGQAGFNKGDMKCTYGTGAFMLLNTGEEVVYSKNGLLSTVAYGYQGKTYYALEGSCYIAGAAVQWLRDNLQFFDTSPEVETLARKVTDLAQMKHLMFMPFFTGVGSPYWNAEIKAAIVGLTRDTSKNHLSLACLDGIALSIHDLISSMEKDLNTKIKSLNVDGGACSNDLLMEIQATISNLEIIKPKVIETTSYGAALAAGIGLDLINFDKISTLWKKETSFIAKDDWKEHYKEKSVTWKNWCEKNC